MRPEVTAIRAQFPAFGRRVNGDVAAYFDAPGGTQVPASVATAVSDYLLHHNANTHWAYPTSVETDAIIAGARAAAADLLGARPHEISIGANMTTLTFHVARGLGRAWGAGDEIVVTDLDHHANIAPWEAIARERGLTLRRAPLDADRTGLDIGALERLIGPRTRLVAVGAASNAIGTITDVAAVSEIAHAHGALLFVDAVHYVPHRLADVTALGADLLACSAYKFHGPHVGLLYVRQELAAGIETPRLAPAPATAPERFETGTLDHEGVAGVTAAVGFLAGLGGTGGERRQRLARGFAWLHAEGERLFERMWNGLGGVRGVKLYGRAPGGGPRTPTVAFTVGAVPSDRVAQFLAARGVFVSSGDFYAATVVERLGLGGQGLVRAGCACYSTDEEVDRLVAGVREFSAAS